MFRHADEPYTAKRVVYNKYMDQRSFVFVDIETDGGTGDRGRITEVAAIRVVDGEIIEEFQSLVNPGHPVPYWITNLTGITTNDVVHAPFFEDIADQLFQFMSGSIFVAHNVLFDFSFLKREFKAAGYSFAPKLFCTVKMSRALFPEHKGHSLQKIIERHNLLPSARHRAYEDARMLFEYVKIAIDQKGIDAFQANLSLQTKTKTLPPNVDEQTILQLPQSTGIYIFHNDAGLPLYVGKSVNIRARVRSHFQNATSIAKEMKMSLSTHNVTYITTETEIEALLLESAKVKELQPLYNRLLRRKTSQHILLQSINDDGYLTFTIESHDIAQYEHLDGVYGVFTTRQQAKQKMEEIARSYQLCPKLLGLEKAKGACFRYQLGLCKGACILKEQPDHYNMRVELALKRTKIETWPFQSKISVAISAMRSLIIDQWVPQAIFDSETNTLTRLERSFDVDTYKIVRSYLRNHRATITVLKGSLEAM